MPRVDLKVRYEEREQVKRLGARWDAANKVWYVPDDVNPAPFAEWFAMREELANVRAPDYFIMRAEEHCWKCTARTPVLGFALPERFEEWTEAEEADGRLMTWLCQDTMGVPAYIEYLHPDIAARAQRLNSTYRRDFSATTEASYWINHCVRCNAKRGDFYLYSEPDGVFSFMSPDAPAEVTFLKINEPFLARAGEVIYLDLP